MIEIHIPSIVIDETLGFLIIYILVGFICGFVYCQYDKEIKNLSGVGKIMNFIFAVIFSPSLLVVWTPVFALLGLIGIITNANRNT